MNNASITQQKNCSITVLRVVSMLMIVICHIYKYYDFLPGSSFMGQFFNVGVQIFLIISGFLYGGKIVQSFKSFFWNRIKRVYFPTVVLSMAVVVVKFLINQKPSANTIFIYLLNLQGLVFLDGRFFQSRICEIDILGPLWLSLLNILVR